ncbi:hypothetical protein HYT33_01395 [Candidatus Roizmanbacteria bacterium]|nr:hypothetical protein [Candidatus Roizmanbacteria bacterium]
MANTLRALISQIRFSLSNLGAQNRFHDFEDICRHFARKRLGLNIIPATGPVQSGGDQGRDFETYKIIPEFRPVKTDVFKVVEGSAAFACTIQKDDIPGKIKSDVKKIVEEGTKVDIVYFFSQENVPVAKRHELQKWALGTYSVGLEIFDGEFLAENLADKDLFWIALEYLQIPSNLYPEVDDIDYLKIKELWEGRTVTGVNYAAFDELRALGRRSLFDKETKHDLTFWVSKLEGLLAFESSAEFKRKVIYEVVALRIRGTGTLKGWEKYIREYFSLQNGFNHPVEAGEAIVVLMYGYGAKFRGAAEITNEELRAWRSQIGEYIEEELRREHPKTIQSVLYELKGSFLVNNPYEDTLDEGLNWWIKVAEQLDETPLFPLERLADLLTAIIEFMEPNPKFDKLTGMLDAHLEKRVGGFAAAEKSRDRALAYRGKGDFGRALKELHKAKASWYAHETLYGSLLSMLLIADTYSELGLNYAAKYYAAAVAYIASRAREEKDKSFLPRGLSALAEYEYMNGEWAHFFEHTDFALKALGVFSTGLDDKRMDRAYERAFFYSSLIHVFTEMLDPVVFKYADRRIKEWNIDIINDLIPEAKKSWSQKDVAELIQKIKTEYYGHPFSDLGPLREVKFEAAGIVWKFKWRNGLIETAKAEQLIAIVQILLAESIHEEFYLLKGNTEISIELGDNFGVKNISTPDKFCWKVTFPKNLPSTKEEIEDFHRRTFAIAITIISELSLLSNARLNKLLESFFREGLINKVMTGSSYEILFSDLTSKELYDEIIPMPPISHLAGLDVLHRPSVFLKWKDGLITEYDETQSKELIEKRYKNSLVPTRITLERLKADEKFKETVRKLRSEEWKDWHILMASALIVVNYRVNARPRIPGQNFKEMTEVFSKEMNKPESEESLPVPAVEFNETELKNSLAMSMVSTFKMLGLELKSPTLTREAIMEFARKRLRYFDDDIPHKDLFEI